MLVYLYNSSQSTNFVFFYFELYLYIYVYMKSSITVVQVIVCWLFFYVEWRNELIIKFADSQAISLPHGNSFLKFIGNLECKM